MEAIKRIHPIVILVVGLVAGVLLGMALFWGLFPVEWTDAQTYDLEPQARAEYVTLVADVYKADRDFNRARRLLELWNDEEKQQSFSDAVQANQQQGRADEVLAVQDLALALGINVQPVAEEEPEPPVQQSGGLLNRLRVPCLVFVFVLLAMVLGMIGYRLLRKPGGKPEADVEAASAPAEGIPSAPVWKGAVGTSLGRWTTTYKFGEDAYDESFPIEAPSGEYLGECGVGISETIGASEPDQVTAFEVWLFDKSDIRTVTKVLMSDYAFHDSALRAKLASKGEALLAQRDARFGLETNGLQVMATVTELEYGAGEQEPNSFFAKLTLDLTAAPKSAAEPAADGGR